MHIRPAPLEREWMDATDVRFAYRCLPLNIANSYGWEILCPSDFTAIWYGSPTTESVSHPIELSTPCRRPWSQFGYGILTFHVNCVFRTQSGFHLLAQGPINRPKDAISPLAGIIETDWAPYTFTMNWAFTRKGVPVGFKAGEPFCHVIPVRRGELETFEPELRDAIRRSRARAPARRAGWQAATSSMPSSGARDRRRRRINGRSCITRAPTWTGRAIAPDHRTRLRVKPFASDPCLPRLVPRRSPDERSASEAISGDRLPTCPACRFAHAGYGRRRGMTTERVRIGGISPAAIASSADKHDQIDLSFAVCRSLRDACTAAPAADRAGLAPLALVSRHLCPDGRHRGLHRAVYLHARPSGQ